MPTATIALSHELALSQMIGGNSLGNGTEGPKQTRSIQIVGKLVMYNLINI